MKNEYKAQLKYEQRKEKRLAKKQAAYGMYDDFDKVFTYHNLRESFKRCRRGVTWKPSVQLFIANAPLRLSKLLTKLRNGKFRSSGFYEFDILERGKPRHIRSVNFEERIVQRCLCDYSLVPILSRRFIYDNGASISGKGYDFAVRRLGEHLHKYYRHHGQDGYILLLDFSKFFDRIPHEYVKQIVRRQYTDERLISLVDYFVDLFPGDKGLGLGSQISQILALASADELDHFIKETLKIKYFGRYMDDSYLIHHDKSYLLECLDRIREECIKYGIVLNEKKVRIVKLSSSFTFLKVRFNLTKSGQVIKRMDKKSVTSMRRKLKKFSSLVNTGRMLRDDVRASYQSWLGHARRFNAYYTIQNMNELYNSLFDGGTADQYCSEEDYHGYS